MPLSEALCVPTVYWQQIILDIGANGRFASYFWNRYPPDLFKRDQHESEVAVISCGIKSWGFVDLGRLGGVPLDWLSVLVQPPWLDLDGVDCSALWHWGVGVYEQQLKRLKNGQCDCECSASSMKQLDWKSFAIGVLLTTTVVFGVAAKVKQEVEYIKPYKWQHLAFPTTNINEFGDR